MFIQSISLLEKEIVSLQSIQKSLNYHMMIEGQQVPLTYISNAISCLQMQIKVIKDSAAYKQDYSEIYGDANEAGHNPLVQVFKNGTNNPFIKRFGGKNDHSKNRRDRRIPIQD